MRAIVVYERQDAFDAQSGPYGFERVGFCISDRVFWTGCAGSGLPGTTYEADKRLAETIVARWNAKDKLLAHVNDLLTTFRARSNAAPNKDAASIWRWATTELQSVVDRIEDD